MTTTPVDRIVRSLGLRRNGGSAGSNGAGRLAELDALEAEWRKAPVRDDRINAHLLSMVERAGITEGTVLEIGGRKHPRGHIFDSAKFTYRNLDLESGDENTVVGDITGCPEIGDNTYDIVISVDVFEHIDRPWLAASEIARIVRPGGLSYTSTLFSWRYHPCPIDFWRYTPDALDFLFADLTKLDSGFDLTERRRDVRKKASADPMPLDAMGGWRENVRVFHAGVGRVTPANG
jgi:SAM-dependent methyltransferase